MVLLASCGSAPDPDVPAAAQTAAGQATSSVSEAATANDVPSAVAPLPKFADIADIPTLKRTFYGYFQPLVAAENERIRKQRKRLSSMRDALHKQEPLPAADRSWILQLAETYELARADAPITPALLDSLMLRVDIVPPRLALAQAAIESGWGRSRFARLGNNIFGQWCFVPGCGIVPGKRPPGATHEVADFDSPAQSIRSYVNNLNTHPAYADWRRVRQRQRRAGALDARELAQELTAYSTLREEYVRRLRSVMRQNEHLIPAD